MPKANDNWTLSQQQKEYIDANYKYRPIGFLQNNLGLSFFAIKSYMDAMGYNPVSLSVVKPIKSNTANVKVFDVANYFKSVQTI